MNRVRLRHRYEIRCEIDGLTYSYWITVWGPFHRRRAIMAVERLDRQMAHIASVLSELAHD